MKTYKLIYNPNTEKVDTVKLTNDNSVIYFHMFEGNADYQEYLKWLAEGNTPEPADE